MKNWLWLRIGAIGGAVVIIACISAFFAIRDGSAPHSVQNAVLLNVIVWGALAVAAVIALAGYIAGSLTKRLVSPITAMADNLDEIEENVPFKELDRFAAEVKEEQKRKSVNERIRREFTANVSHELKTPLTSISGYAEMISSGMARPEDTQIFAERIHLEAGRMIALIGDIIRLTEMDEPAFEMPKEKVDLHEIALEAMDILSFSAKQNDVTLKLSGESSIVTGNKSMLSELIFNLADNAIRYNKPGGIVEIATSMTVYGAGLMVKDSGIGMADEHLSRIFERFYRIDKSRSKQTGGTGLGLAIVKHIVIRHGAEITVDSKLGKGTAFTILFPCAKEEKMEEKSE